MIPEACYVLIIDDNANNAQVTTELLRMVGVKYISARASGWQALKLAEGMAQIDMILLNLQLPHEDAYGVLECIRSITKLKNACVVAVGFHVFPQDQARARAAGFDDLISKPLDFDRFPQQILMLLNKL